LSSAKRVADTGVAIYFIRKGKQMCIHCDRWDRVEDNIHAIAKTIEAMRGIERWGTGDMVDATFTGVLAISAPDDWRTVLGHPTTLEQAEAAYRKAARSAPGHWRHR
jgi:hypothetical protein